MRSSVPERCAGSQLRAGLLATLTATLLVVTACGSESSDDDPSAPIDSGTVVPPDDNGVGGGVPVDNLNPNVADSERQELDDVDGDGDPEP